MCLLKAEFHLILPGPQQGPQVVSSVWGEPVAADKRGDGPEHRTTSAGRLVNSGSRENIESVSKKTKQKDKTTLCVGYLSKIELCEYNLMMSPCSVTPHREPSASAGRPLTPCGNRTACPCSHNIWTVWAEDERRTNYDLFCFRLR